MRGNNHHGWLNRSGGTMSEAKFRIEYSGPALRDGTMDVRDLAPALLGLGDACTRANRILNHGSTTAGVHVNADFQRGSFDVLLTLVTSTPAKDLLGQFADAAQVLEYLGLGGGGAWGVVQLAKWLKGRKPDAVEKAGPGIVSITIDNCTINVPRDTYELARNADIRRSLQKAVAPLNNEGIDEVRLGAHDSPEPVSISRDELPAFSPAPEAWDIDAVEVYRSTVHAPYEIVQIPFDDDLVWRLRELDEQRHRFSARMADEEFIADVREGRHSFTCGDIMVADLMIENRLAPTGPTVTRTIMRVEKLIRHPRKPDLPELPLPPSGN